MAKRKKKEETNDDSPNKTPPYYKTIPIDEAEEEEEIKKVSNASKKKRPGLQSYTAPKEVLEDITLGEHRDPLNFNNDSKQKGPPSYHKKRERQPSPDRNDPLSISSKDKTERSYKDIMREQKVKNEQIELLRKQQRDEYNKARHNDNNNNNNSNNNTDSIQIQSNDNDDNNNNNNIQDDNLSVVSKETKLTNNVSEWDKIEKKEDSSNYPNYLTSMTPRRRRWDINTMTTPVNPTNLMETPKGNLKLPYITIIPSLVNRDLNQSTPLNPYLQMTPTPSQLQQQQGNKTKWDETPNALQHQSLFGATPTPGASFNIATPTPGIIPLVNNLNFDMRAITLENIEMLKYDKDLQERNHPLTDEEIDLILPMEGYEIVQPPESYIQFLNNYRENQALKKNTNQINDRYTIPQENNGINASSFSGLKPDDMKFFNSILSEVDESKLSTEELRERNIMTLLLKVKNGAPPMRKSALRQITEKAREFGAGPLFNQIIPLLMSPSLEDQERHLLVKVIDRILFKLDDLIRPYVHKILVAIMPMLRDENSYARIEGREIISNLAKSAGLATMISTMRPDIDSPDESIRNVTSKAFAVVASALGLPAILPFLKAVCQSKKSWLARDTGIRIVQQIAILMGCAVLPYLKSLVEIIENGLKDEQQKVSTFTALALAALAEASYPYGIDAFNGVLRHLFDGIRQYKGKTLVAFFKALGFIIPLMDPGLAARSTKLIIPILKRDFNHPDENTKKIILKVLKQCISTERIEANYIRTDVKADFFDCFWNRRMSLDRKNYKSVIEATLEIAKKIGGREVLSRIVIFLKEESEILRKMTLEAVNQIVSLLGLHDIDKSLEIALIQGLKFSFQEQSLEDSNNIIVLNCFGVVVQELGLRIKAHISEICNIIQWGFSLRNAKNRQYSADLIVKVANSMQLTGEEYQLGKLSIVLNENLGEEYPEVLGSIIAALKAIVSVVGLTKMTPPIKDLLPRLTPILKNRHEKVQENVIDLIGLIADKGANYVSPKEWMRISFDLLDLLKAHKKIIRRATVNTFGYIAKAIGPQEVLITLLNNLKVQERQNRVCTTVAIAIVSETCGPYTVIPALMNEYRIPELNVQNGVLKSIAFLFEYIGEMARDYIYAIIPILEDALTERDLVHRQIAASAIRHLALGVAGLNCEDGLTHLLNYIWPNIFETSPHVVIAVMDALEGLRVGLGVNIMMSYIVQGLFHPARRIRDTYWKIYNMMYIGAADAMTACYPRLPNDDTTGNSYVQSELELFI